MSQPKSILVTGGCGFIGSNLAAHYLDKGYSVSVLDNFWRVGSRQNLEWLKERAEKSKGTFQFYEVDLRERSSVQNLLSQLKPEAVLHFAGQVAATVSIQDPYVDFSINAEGTFYLLDAVRESCPEALFVFASTNKVYGDLSVFGVVEEETRYTCPEHQRGFNEKTPLDFYSPYGCSKGAADQYVRDFGRIYNMHTVVLRLSTIYGGRQFATYDQGWIGWFVEQVIRQERFSISGNGKQVRDILHAHDLIALIDSLMKKATTLSGEIFNIGGGIDNSLSIRELISYLEKTLGCKADSYHIDARKGDQPFYVSNIQKAQDKLEWVPKVDKWDGVNKMIEWVNSGIK
ncbi:MAG: CDP-paratose 2-epimerase [Deltaproteobacteria bacterium CG11_big_fil_rev_8_21_14_0_20_47_16]|nr:MAG: CDP-paratose 2-epimerase [Deltaproteobacteria bacterium CG11_big_fil_rev_8_21_14_0_20_47_16]